MSFTRGINTNRIFIEIKNCYRLCIIKYNYKLKTFKDHYTSIVEKFKGTPALRDLRGIAHNVKL